MVGVKEAGHTAKATGICLAQYIMWDEAVETRIARSVDSFDVVDDYRAVHVTI